MNGKKSILILFIILCLCIFFGCSNSFDNLVIVCQDAGGIEEGEYTLVYSIKDYEKLATKYNLTIKVKAFDQNNAEVPVKNNRVITVQKDFVYTIVVYCSTTIKDETVTKNRQFIVTAIKSPPSVNFILKYENITSLQQSIPLEYNQSLLLSDVPSLPDWYANYIEGIQKTIISKKWVVYIDGEEIELNQTHLNNIQSAVNVYGIYTYEIVYVPIAYIFVANGGTQTATISGIRGNSINRPINPTRTGFTFDCWCIDSALTTPYNWKEDKTYLKSHTLYAKWLEEVGNYTDYSYFNFLEATDDYGNKYYTISAKTPQSIQLALTLPNGYNNIPIKKIAEMGFRNGGMTSVFIPNSITILGQNSFEGCVNLHTVNFQQGNTMTTLGWYSFKGCVLLNSINNLPQSITDLGSETFQDCTSLESFTIPSGVTLLKTKLFMGCSSLVSINIPDSVTEILSNAFKDCTALTSLNFTNKSKLIYIIASAVENTAITSIVLPHFFSTVANPFASTTIAVDFYAAPPKED